MGVLKKLKNQRKRREQLIPAVSRMLWVWEGVVGGEGCEPLTQRKRSVTSDPPVTCMSPQMSHFL